MRDAREYSGVVRALRSMMKADEEDDRLEAHSRIYGNAIFV